MLILAIDTSTRMGSAAVLRDCTVLGELSGYEETPYSSRLFRDVEELQKRIRFGLDEVDLFAVAAGPGSFTGLRVGLTAAKAWAEVHQKPIAAISGLEAIASGYQTGGTPSTPMGAASGSHIVSFLDARRGQVFGAVYRNETGVTPALVLAGDELILAPDEFLGTVKEATRSSRVHFVSPTPEAIPAKVLDEFFPEAKVVVVSAALAPAIGCLGFERALRGEVADPIRVDANYVRRTDAEAAWKDS